MECILQNFDSLSFTDFSQYLQIRTCTNEKIYVMGDRMRNKHGFSNVVAAVGKDAEENYGRNGLWVGSRLS